MRGAYVLLDSVSDRFLAARYLCDHAPHRKQKRLELLILRHQINILEHQVKRPRVSRLEKLSLAVIANKLKQRADRTRQQLAQSILIFKPETVLGWHRELVRRKWTFKQSRQPGTLCAYNE